jgi:hypothetical protein
LVVAPVPALAKIKVGNFYCWDELSGAGGLQFKNSQVRINMDGNWIPCIGVFTFDNDIVYDNRVDDPNNPDDGNYTAPLACNTGQTGTKYGGEVQLGVYYKDTAADNYAQGFWASRGWTYVLCDRAGDGGTGFGNTDQLFGDVPSVTYYTGTDATFRTILSDQINTCSGGNCSEMIVTYSFLNLDANCNGTLEGTPATAGGLCYYTELHKPGSSTQYPWKGPLQAALSATNAGEKTVNFSPQYNETPVIASSFRVEATNGAAAVSWESSSEIRTAAFNLYRAVGARWVLVNELPLRTLPPSPDGSSYRVIDPGALPGNSYTWAIGEFDVRGTESFSGPFTATVETAGTSPAVVAQKHPVRTVDVARTTQRVASSFPSLIQAGTSSRVGITQSGLYKINAGEIASTMGMTVAQAKTLIANRGLALKNKGRPVAYAPLAANAGILFYGEKADSLYTDENVYWISRGPGLGMTSASGRSPAPAPGRVFPSPRHEESDTWALTALFDDPAADFWLWDFVMAGYPGYDAKNFMVKADGAAASGTATLTINLKGGYDDKAVAPDHRVQVAVNGTVVGETTWDGIAANSLALSVNQGLLVDGENSVTVTSLLAPGVVFNNEWVDSLDLVYQRHYQAVDGSLLLTGSGNPVVTVGGFVKAEIRLLDVTNPLAPVQINGVTRDLGPDRLNRISFRPVSPGAVYLATTDLKSPASIRPFVPARLNRSGNAADYVVIAPKALAVPAAELAAYRGSQGHASRVVDLQAIYDEFNYGLAEPVAIRQFLAYATSSWLTKPRFVVLAGKGTIDYKNLRGVGDNLLPIWIAATPHGLFAADNRFADLLGNDGVPELAIGRLPVVNAEEMALLVAKLKAYEAADGAWRQQVLMAADKADPLAGDFPVDSAEVAALVPADAYAVTSIPLTTGSIGIDRPKLLQGLNLGAYLFNYIGHGAITYLANDRLLASSDMGLLQNGEKLSLASMMTCLASRYEMYGVTSLGEAMLLDVDGGSAAVWSATGYSQNSQAVLLDKGLFRSIFGGTVQTYGEAVLDALRNYRADGGNSDYMLDIYNLLGDPATRLR